MPDFNRLALGEFNPHREDLAADDAAAFTDKRQGVNTLGYDGIMVELKVRAGSLTGATLEVLYWSAAAGKFVPSVPTADSAAVTAPGQHTFQDTGDRIVLVKLTDLSGTNPHVDILVSPLRRRRQCA